MIGKGVVLTSLKEITLCEELDLKQNTRLMTQEYRSEHRNGYR